MMYICDQDQFDSVLFHAMVTNFILSHTDAPEFQQGNLTEEISSGGAVTVDCRAEGNPSPVLQWVFTSAESQETTRGNQSSINITGATSTNAGIYICVATNKVGSVTRSTTLIMKGTVIDCAEHIF